MEKNKTYELVHFSADVLREAEHVYRSQFDLKKGVDFSYSLSVNTEEAEWGHDSLEEFFSDYRRMSAGAYFSVIYWDDTNVSNMVVRVSSDKSTTVRVKGLPRPQIESVFEVFEKHVNDARLPIETFSYSKPKVFIGHGRSLLWKDLKDHLQDQHDYDVLAYEVGARAGHTIRDILEEMLSKSAFAILVMTGDDKTRDNELRPRLNVVHELGLFQGRLGFSRAIMLLEEETQELSNMHGVHQIRFSRGNIKETFGDVLATLNREFPVSVS